MLRQSRTPYYYKNSVNILERLPPWQPLKNKNTMIDSLDKLINSNCRPIPKSQGPMNLTDAQGLLNLLDGWTFCADLNQLCKTYRFGSYSQTIDFVNRVASIAQEQDHHPNMEVGYQRCKVAWITHTVNGLSESDFICAAKIDAR